MRAPLLVLVAAVGILVGLGSFTVWYARGYSYLSDDPMACVNCHIMRDNFDSWTVSSHRELSCNDCHVPHDFVGKWLAKAEHGFWHSYAFTLGNVQVIRIKQKSYDDVQENCRSCHEPMTSFITRDDMSCSRCHRYAGHTL